MLKKIVLIGTLVTNGALSAMTLDEYLSAVEGKNLDYKAAQEQAEASGLVVREADLITSPKFFASLTSVVDNKLSSPPFKTFDELRNTNLKAGVSQTFDFGLDLKLSMNLTKHQFVNYNAPGSGTGGDPNYWDAQPSLEFTMPLWAGGFGRLVKAQKELTSKQSIADGYANKALSLQTIMQAENAYWALSLAQDKVDIQSKSLVAGKSILSFVDGQRKKNLGESADVLQARALVEAYELQLKQAQNELQRAQRNFNKLLNEDSLSAVVKLPNVNYSALQKIRVPAQRPGERFDVLARKAQNDLSRASSDLVLERNKPSLNLMGGYTMQGRNDDKIFKASSNSFDNDNNSRYIGIQFQMPLNIKAMNDARSGAMRLKAAADIRDANIVYTQDQEWIELRESLSEAQDSLKLTLAMQNAQRAKLENERVRLRQGRTTTYQVLLFEQDYTNAQASTIQVANYIIALNSQVKLYQTNTSGDK